MKILYLCSDTGIPVLGRKGASVHVRSLVAAFAAAGHDVTLVAPTLVGAPGERAAAIDARVVHVPPAAASLDVVDAVDQYGGALGVATTIGSELRRVLYNRDLEARLPAQLAEFRADFIYERAAVYGTAGVSLARRLGVPLLVELNAPLALEQATYRSTAFARLAYEAERHTLSNADRVLSVSSPLRDYVIAHGIGPERVHVVPNGVDVSAFSPEPCEPGVRGRWNLGHGPVVGFVGGLRPWHGVRVLPELVVRLARTHPAVKLVIAGDGPLRHELMAAFRERGVADRVVFTGLLQHGEIPGLIHAFDIALAPYEQPTHLFYFSPLKLFEYMACGVAVVAAGIGQIADVVDDGRNGLLYAPGDSDGLVAACERLLADEPLRRELGRSAAATVRLRFTWGRNADTVVGFAATSLRQRAFA